MVSVDNSDWVFPPSEVHEIHEYISKQNYFFIDCPYGQCWYVGRYMYHVQYFSLFAGYPYNECFFEKPYKEPLVYHCEEGCPDVQMDYKEYCEEGKLEYRRQIDSYALVYRYYGNHTHKELQCTQSPAGNMIVPICNALRAKHSTKITKVDELKSFMDERHVDRDDHVETNIVCLDNVEKQWLINKLYPYIEDEGEPIDLYAKNLRLGVIQVSVETISRDYMHLTPVGNRHIDSLEYSLHYNSLDWNAPTRYEMLFRRLDYDPSDEYYPESGPED